MGPDLRGNFMLAGSGIDDSATVGLVGRNLEETLPQGLVELLIAALVGIILWVCAPLFVLSGGDTLKCDVDLKIEDQCQIWLCLLDHQLFKL